MSRVGPLWIGMLVILASGTPARTQEGDDNTLYGAFEEIASDWHVFGDITHRLDYFEIGGDADRSIFAFTGDQSFIEPNVNFRRQFSTYNKVSGNFFGLVNSSDFRNLDRGFVPERGHVEWENGDVATPFRVKAGDFFGFISPRTLQRPLKGVVAEIQPQLGEDFFHSIMLLGGFDAPEYPDLNNDPSADLGVSWVMADPNTGGVYAFNLVFNEASPTGFDDREQFVGTVAGEQEFQAGGQTLSLEGEAGMLRGDVGNTGAALEGQSDFGLFLEMRGKNETPLTYSLTFERYGQDYIPAHGTIISDRLTTEARAAWRFDGGLRLRGRLQRFEDALESTNSLRQVIAGVNLTGPYEQPWIENLSGAFDTFFSNSENDDDTVLQDALTSSLNLNAPIGADWTGSSNLFFRYNNDSVNKVQSHTKELTLSADRRLEYNGITGQISPDMTYRHVGGDVVESHDLGGGLSLVRITRSTISR